MYRWRLPLQRTQSLPAAEGPVVQRWAVDCHAQGVGDEVGVVDQHEKVTVRGKVGEDGFGVPVGDTDLRKNSQG